MSFTFDDVINNINILKLNIYHYYEAVQIIHTDCTHWYQLISVSELDNQDIDFKKKPLLDINFNQLYWLFCLFVCFYYRALHWKTFAEQL